MNRESKLSDEVNEVRSSEDEPNIEEEELEDIGDETLSARPTEDLTEALFVRDKSEDVESDDEASKTEPAGQVDPFTDEELEKDVDSFTANDLNEAIHPHGFPVWRNAQAKDLRTNPDGTTRHNVLSVARGPERFEQLTFARDSEGHAYDGIAVEIWRTWHAEFRGNGDRRHEFYNFSEKGKKGSNTVRKRAKQEELEWERCWQMCVAETSNDILVGPDDPSSDQQNG